MFNTRTWVTYSQKLKALKEERLSRLSNEKAKILKEVTEATLVLQKHWRRYK